MLARPGVNSRVWARSLCIGCSLRRSWVHVKPFTFDVGICVLGLTQYSYDDEAFDRCSSWRDILAEKEGESNTQEARSRACSSRTLLKGGVVRWIFSTPIEIIVSAETLIHRHAWLWIACTIPTTRIPSKMSVGGNKGGFQSLQFPHRNSLPRTTGGHVVLILGVFWEEDPLAPFARRSSAHHGHLLAMAMLACF